MTDRPGRGATLATELAVVIVGVLIALWAEGLASDRRASAELRTELALVKDELAAAGTELASQIAAMTEEAPDLRRLAEISRGGPTPPSDSMPDLVNNVLMVSRDFRPDLSAFHDLQSSGRLSRVTNPRVREALDALERGLLLAELYAEANLVVPQRTMFDPFVIQELPAAIEKQAARVDSLYPIREPSSNDWAALRGERARGLLAARMTSMGFMREVWSNLLTRFEEAIGEIDDELGPGVTP